MIRAIVGVGLVLAAQTADASPHFSYHAPACHDAIDVVGYRHCSEPFGSWAAPPPVDGRDGLPIDLGVLVRRIDLSINKLSFTGARIVANSHVFIIGEAARIQLPGMAFDMLLGRSVISAPATATMDGAAPQAWNADATSFESTVTFSRSTHGHVRIGVELAIGGEMAAVDATPPNSPHNVGEVARLQVAPVLEPRLRLGWFVSPHVTLTLTVGANLAEPGEYTFALTLSPHSRAYDGR